jgi:pilus assembly protein CpaF
MPLFRRATTAAETSPASTNGVADVARRPIAARRAESDYADLKTRIHRQLIEQLDLSKLDLIPPDVLEREIARIVQSMLEQEATPLSRQERERVVREIWHETFGLGPIEPLMRDPTVSDILVNGARTVYVERQGKLERTEAIFRDDAHLLQIIERIVSRVGRRVDESSPMVDARLQDGSRVNAVIPPLALDGPILSIRRFAAEPYRIADLINLGTLAPALAEILTAAVKVRLNILVAGGTGAGKTTLLNVLSNAIPNDERIVTIEDSAELQLQ